MRILLLADLHYREDWYPALLDRNNYGTWQAQGATTLRDRASRKVDELLKAHQPVSLPGDTVKALRAVVDEA